MPLHRFVPIMILAGGMAAWAQQTSHPSAAAAGSTPNAAHVSQSSTVEIPAPNPAAKQSIQQALQSASKAGRRVLVMYGGAWCHHCSELEQAMASTPDAASLLRDGFVAVHINVDDLVSLQQFAQKLDPELKLTSDNGPLLTVLDKDGSLLDARTATRLLDQNAVSPTKVAKFLTRWTLQAPAEEVYQKALAELRSSGKLGFVEFGADWCVWCHHMDNFFDQSAAASILHNYYVRIPVDYERNEGAPELARQLGAPAGDGLPLWAVVTADGKALANSNSAKGNIGYPGTPQEIAEFVAIVQSTAKGISPEQLQTIQNALQTK